MARGVQFTRGAAERVAKATRRVEGMQSQPPRMRGASNGTGEVYRILVGKADGAISINDSGTVSRWSGTTSSGLTDTSDNDTVYTRLGAIPSGAWVYYVELPWGYEAINIYPCS